MSNELQPGTVYLAGAGPGDPDLLTLRAAELLKTCDVILPDDLVSDAILDMASPTAEIIPVGKRCGQPRITQAGIHELMLKHAKAGSSVLRLKSGDPLVFGRAGEEIAFLREHAIPFPDRSRHLCRLRRSSQPQDTAHRPLRRIASHLRHGTPRRR